MMHRASAWSCLLLACVAVAASPALAQTTRVDGGAVSNDTYGFYWELHLTPAVPPLAPGFRTFAYRGDSGVIHRVLLDRVRRILFGYDVRIEWRRDHSRYQLQLEPLSMTPERRRELLGSDFASWTQLPPPGLARPGRADMAIRSDGVHMVAIRQGHVLQLNLLTTDSGQTLTDYVTIQQPSRQFDGLQVVPAPAFHVSPGPAQDFPVSDVQLQLLAPRVTINDTRDPSTERGNHGVRGAVVWFYLPNRGRYLLSLLPQPELDFNPAGEVRGSLVRFTLGGDTITLLVADQVAPGPGAYILYVRHEPAWRPTYPNANVDAFMLGAADRAEDAVEASGR